jgi:hypothetical protein
MLEDLHLSSLFLPIFLAFLVPIAVYCLILSGINRRPHPVMVSGIWDTVGLLFAASGALLAGGPGIIAILFDKLVGRSPFTDEPGSVGESIGKLLLEWLGVWILYYILVAGGAVFLLWIRRHKTVIYNIGPKQWELIFDNVLSRLGLEQSRAGKNIYLGNIGPLDEPTQVLSPGPGNPTAITTNPSVSPVLSRCSALIQVDVFPALCNVTLHWENPAPLVRQEIEAELARALTRVDSPENPAATWFLAIGGILLGIGFLLLLVVILFVLFPPRNW